MLQISDNSYYDQKENKNIETIKVINTKAVNGSHEVYINPAFQHNTDEVVFIYIKNIEISINQCFFHRKHKIQ